MTVTWDGDEYEYITQDVVDAVEDFVNGLSDDERKDFQDAWAAEQSLVITYGVLSSDKADEMIKQILRSVNSESSGYGGLDSDISNEYLDATVTAFINADATIEEMLKQFGFAGQYAERDAAEAFSEAAGTAEREGLDPTLGYLETGTEFDDQMGGAVPINEATLRQHFAGYDDETKKVMAMELALNGFYGLDGYDLVFDENGELNDKAFAEAVTSVFNYAQSFGPEGKTIEGPAGDKVLMGGLNIPKFFNIITRQTGLSAEEITSLFDAELAEAEASAIQFIDKYSIYEAINTASTNLLGREATKQEKDIFYNMMYELQLSDDAPRAIDISARADASITEGTLAPDPIDYGMDFGIGGDFSLDAGPSGKDLLEGEYQANRKARAADMLLRLIIGGR